LVNWNHEENARLPSAHAHRERVEATALALAAARGGLMVLLEQRQQLIPGLFAQHLAHEPPERFDVLAQRRVARGETAVLAVHGGRHSNP
jgi:hypothetical protein